MAIDRANILHFRHYCLQETMRLDMGSSLPEAKTVGASG